MKKVIVLLIAVCFVLGMFGCSNNSNNNGLVEISYDTKYYRTQDFELAENKRPYYIFNENGTAEKVVPNEYTITFKYDISKNGTVVLLFYSIDNEQEFETSRERLIIESFSKNIFVSSTGGIYVNENYLEEIPNYGK